MRFHIASEEMIKQGQTTDIYFARTEEILRKRGFDRVRVVADVITTSFPRNWNWGLFCGIEELTHLLENKPVTVYSMDEGSLFFSYEPVLWIEGNYVDFAVLETAILGLIAQASGIATAAAHCKLAAGDHNIISFGIRRMHPAISPMVDRAAYIGGCDGFSGVAAAKLLKIEAVGTMPHALIIAFGNQVVAWKAFDEIMDKDIPRLALVDTYADEKAEAIMAAEALGKKLQGVRLDTPSSRRGDMARIVKEVRWELDLRGFKHVKIFVSGGLDEHQIKELIAAGADAFGVGTYISGAPPIDFALDIVEADGKPAAKRVKLSVKKQVYRCPNCLSDTVVKFVEKPSKCKKCKAKLKPMLHPLIENGKLVRKLPNVREIRKKVLAQLGKIGN